MRFCAFIVSSRLGTPSLRTSNAEEDWVMPRLPSQNSRVAIPATSWSDRYVSSLPNETSSRPYNAV